MQNIINLGIIPLTLVISTVALRMKFHVSRFVGGSLILAGIIFSLLLMLAPSYSMNASWRSVLVYTSNNVPGAFSNVLKQFVLMNMAMDVFYLGSWVAWFQLSSSLLFIPVLSLHSFGGITIDQLPRHMYYGWQCFIGVNSLLGDNCHRTWIPTILYVFINFSYHVCILWVTKYAGSKLFSVAFVMRLPLAQICFCLSIIMGPYAEQFSYLNFAALLLVLIGFSVYSYTNFRLPEHNLKSNDKQIQSEVAVIPQPFHSQSQTGVVHAEIKLAPKQEKDLRNRYMEKLGFPVPVEYDIL